VAAHSAQSGRLEGALLLHAKARKLIFKFQIMKNIARWQHPIVGVKSPI
jgi:hypothetical protein